eukprot:830409-Amphidinium_carterae.1
MGSWEFGHLGRNSTCKCSCVEEEEEEEEDETSYGMLSEEQKAAVEAIITASRKAANITDVLREELAC